MATARSSSFMLLVLAIAGGCGDDAAGPSIESLGEGPANERPLWVPRAGPLGPSSASGAGYAMSADRLIDGRRVFLAGWQRGTFEPGYGPAEPYFARLYGRHEDGIYLEGDTRAGLYREPVLFVPSTVRVGMRWSHPPRWKFEVVDRDEGEPRTWVIEVTDAERLTTNRENTKVLFGVPYRLTYLEGSPVGPFAGGISDQNGERGGRNGWLGQDVVPPPAAPREVPELALRPLNGGDPISEESAVPSFFGAVVDPDGDRVDLVVDGLVPFFHPGAQMFLAIEGSGCHPYLRSADAFATAIDPKDCRDARATIIDGAGRALRIGNEGWEPHVDCTIVIGPDGIMSCTPVDYHVAGIFRAEDGTAMVFRGGRLSDVGPHSGVEGEPMTGLEPGSFTPIDSGAARAEIGGVLWLAEPEDDGWTMLAVHDGGLKTVHLRPDGAVHATTFRDEGGNLGITSDASGRRYLRTHPDGAIERVVWDRDGVRVQPLGTIGLEEGRVLAGAVELEDRLLVLTLHGFEGNDPQYGTRGHLGGHVNVGADRAIRPELGELRLWEADVPPDPGPPIEAGELTRLGAALDAGGADAAICDFSGEAPTDGWTIAGAPAIVFPNNTRCVTVVGDKVRVVAEASGFVRGSLPTLGALSLQLEPGQNTWDQAFLGEPGAEWVDPFSGALPLADGSGFAVCERTSSDGEDGACLAWRIFDRDWKKIGDGVTTASALKVLPDPERCTTLAGASCSVHSLALLDCRGPGAPGPTLLPDFGVSSAGVPDNWVIEACWPVDDTLWIALHRNQGGERRELWRVDTRAWTFTPAALDAAARTSAQLTPEGEPVLTLHDGRVMVKLKADHMEPMTLPFDRGGARFAGPLILGGSVEGAELRLWRRDGPHAHLSQCGDDALDPGEHCPEDGLCVPGTARCEPGGEYLATCHDDGQRFVDQDCSVVCDSQSCHGSGERCVEGACVPTVLCGAVRCEPGEACVDAELSPRCAVLPRCGDGLCQAEEEPGACVDCDPPSTWDGVCVWAERAQSDCGTCGDGVCSELEPERCPEDCAGCGDDVCAPGERDLCPEDCPGCGDGRCWGVEPYPEEAGYCPEDCLPCEADRPGCFREGIVRCDAQGVVSDYTPCDAGELCEGGACVSAGVCGNGRCEAGETAACADCGP
ncbi:MAG: hypothetical protein IT385_04095 [Deltaproteobacteria bacterium]|nr:hypothetical protein [Deltaproteobacteria bacterium]